MNIYYMINWFFLCSLLGYLLECVVLTYENRTPVLNRGFGHGPFLYHLRVWGYWG